MKNKVALPVLLVLVFLIGGALAQNDDGLDDNELDVPTLIYAQYVDLYESHIVSQRPDQAIPELIYILKYPGEVDALVASPLHGLYYLFDNELHTREGEIFTSQWFLPAVDTITDLVAQAVNPTVFAQLNGQIMINDIVLSPTEEVIAYDLSTVGDDGKLADEFIVIYHRATGLFRLIEIEDRDLVVIDSITNLRWSPDGDRLAYAYPTHNRVDSEHITIVSDCIADTALPCTIQRIDLPDDMPFMQTFDWSPDGTQFAYSCSDTHLASHEICVINIDGTDLQKYDTAVTYKSDLHWSPDGRTLVYVAHPPGHQEQDIYLLDLETGEEINFSATPDILESVPFWLRHR